MMRPFRVRAGRALAVLIAQVGLAGTCSARSPENNSAQPPEFEVASIKPSHSDGVRPLFDIKPELFRATNVPVNRLIAMAYGIKALQIAGAPEWCGSDLFDINAKPPARAKADELNRMLQSLLAGRFGLVVERERRELPVYALMPARSGSKTESIRCRRAWPERRRRLPVRNRRWFEFAAGS